MQIAILQSAGEHPENAHFREALSLQRAFRVLGSDAVVIGPGYGDYLKDLDVWLGNVDGVLVLENYWRAPWLDFLPERVVRQGTRLAFWSIDAHVPAAAARQLQLVKAQKIPLVFCSTESTQDMFRRIGTETMWLPNAYDATLIHPTDDPKRYDIGFCGRLIAGRGEFFQRMQPAVHVDEWVLGEAMVKAINEYRIHLNRSYNYDINYRCFETCGCRTALVTNRVPGIEKIFTEGVHCRYYATPGQCSEVLRDMLANPSDTLLMAYAAHEHVLKNHTYVNRARTIIERMF